MRAGTHLSLPARCHRAGAREQPRSRIRPLQSETVGSQPETRQRRRPAAQCLEQHYERPVLGFAGRARRRVNSAPAAEQQQSAAAARAACSADCRCSCRAPRFPTSTRSSSSTASSSTRRRSRPPPTSPASTVWCSQYESANYGIQQGFLTGTTRPRWAWATRCTSRRIRRSTISTRSARPASRLARPAEPAAGIPAFHQQPLHSRRQEQPAHLRPHLQEPGDGHGRQRRQPLLGPGLRHRRPQGEAADPRPEHHASTTTTSARPISAPSPPSTSSRPKPK